MKPAIPTKISERAHSSASHHSEKSEVSERDIGPMAFESNDNSMSNTNLGLSNAVQSRNIVKLESSKLTSP